MFDSATRQQEICGWVIVAAFLLVRLFFALTRRDAPSNDNKLVAGRYYLRVSYFLIAAFAILSVTVPRDAKGWSWAFVPLHPAVKWFGAAFGFLAVLLFWYVHRELGNNWQGYIVMQGEAVLSTTGPFALARHPMYTVFLMFIISMFLISGFIIPCIALLITWSWAVSGIPQEERAMIIKFGDDYIAYRRKVGAFCPWAMPCDFMVVAMQAQAVKLTTTEDGEYQELFG